MKLFLVCCLIAFTAVAAQDESAAYVEDTLEAASASAQKGIAEVTSEFVQNAGVEVAGKGVEVAEKSIFPFRCFGSCAQIYRPVCAYSFCFGIRTFYNLCELNRYNRCNYNGYRWLANTSCERLYSRCYRRSFIYYLDKDVSDLVKSSE